MRLFPSRSPGCINNSDVKISAPNETALRQAGLISELFRSWRSCQNPPHLVLFPHFRGSGPFLVADHIHVDEGLIEAAMAEPLHDQAGIAGLFR